LHQQQAATIAAVKQRQQKESFKWGQRTTENNSSIKSLAEIQAEEAAELAKVFFHYLFISFFSLYIIYYFFLVYIL